MKAYQLKAAIKKSKPLTWRRCLVPAGITYSQLGILLSSLMEENEEEEFSFEFYQKKIRFREDDGIRPFCCSDFYYDLAEASENYIDELLDQEEWFSFYYGEDLALRVSVEKRLEYSGENYPIIMAGRGDICTEGLDNYDLRESLQKKQDEWKQAFPVSYGGPEYKKRDEIRKELADGRYGLHCCSDAVSDSHRTQHSGNYYMQKFAEQISGALWKTSELEKEQKDFREKLYNDAVMGGLVGASMQPEEKNGSIRPSETGKKSGLEILLKDILLNYEKEELKNFGRELHLRISSLNKDMLAEKIANEMLMGDVMRKSFLILRDEEISAWEACIRQNECFRPSAHTLAFLERIYERKYLVIYDDDYVDIPKDVIQKYHKINTPEFQNLRRQVAWMLDCLWMHARIYGSAPVSVMIRMYRKRQGFHVNREEWCSIFDRIPEPEQQWVLDQDKVITKALFEREAYRKVEAMQGSREFYIPDAEEIMDCSRNGYPSQNPHYQNLKCFFLERLELEEIRADNMLRLAWNRLPAGYQIPEIMRRLRDAGIELKRAKDRETLTRLLEDVSDHTRMMKYRGYTPREYSDKEQQEPELLSRYPVLSPAAGKPGKTNVKIYPNAPCPCGSGKKYKKCCGK